MTPTADGSLALDRRSVLGSVILAVFVVSLAVLPAFLTGAVAVEMREDFELGPSTLGLLVGLFFGCAALSSGPAGQLVAPSGIVICPLTTPFAAVGTRVELKVQGEKTVTPVFDTQLLGGVVLLAVWPMGWPTRPPI